MASCVVPARGVAQGASDGFRILRVARSPDGASAAAESYDGTIPGPLLRVRRGDELKIRLLNELPQPTTVHWHGVRLRNAMDGVPSLTQAAIASGTSFDYRFAPPDAGTFWYHPSAPAGRGLYGMLVVEEAAPVEIDREAVLILDDGDTPTANGGGAFDIPIRTHERLRLRVLNAAYAQPFALRIDGHRPIVMAIDGQPAEPFAARDGHVALGPGNRVDLFVDGVLTSGASAVIAVETAAGPVTVARLVYGSEPARPAPRPAPRPLPPNPLPDRIEFRGAQRVDVAIAGAVARELAARPLFSVKRGRTVMLNAINRTETTQVLHVHGHSFRLLDRLDDGWKPFWLDTLPIEPKGNARIAFLADNPGKWLIGAHAREPSLATWFEVT